MAFSWWNLSYLHLDLFVLVAWSSIRLSGLLFLLCEIHRVTYLDMLSYAWVFRLFTIYLAHAEKAALAREGLLYMYCTKECDLFLDLLFIRAKPILQFIQQSNCLIEMK